MIQSTSYFLRVNGLITHARVYEPSQPQGDLVVVPGLGCDAWMYERLARYLARWYRVWVYDPPGHGLSEGRSHFPVSADQLSAHLKAWLSKRGLLGAPLLGHSLGGEVVLRLAARLGGRAGPLIACAPTGIPFNPSVPTQLGHLLLDIPRERPAL